MASGQVSYFVALAPETISRPYPPDVTDLFVKPSRIIPPGTPRTMKLSQKKAGMRSIARSGEPSYNLPACAIQACVVRRAVH